MSAVPRDRRDRTLAQQLSAAFVLFGVLVAAAFFSTALSYGVSWGWLTPQFEDSRLAVRAEAAAYTAMLDEENGVRGFLLTHDVGFAEPYVRGELERTKANEALGSYVDAVSEFADPMLTTRLAEERWRERWAKPNADTQPGAVAPSMADGKALFDAYRRDQAAFVEVLRQHRDLLSVREQRLIMGRVALELLVFGMVLLLAWRQHRALRAAIVEPVAALLEHIRRVRDGQLQATVDPTGPRELRQLGEGLNEMVSA